MTIGKAGKRNNVRAERREAKKKTHGSLLENEISERGKGHR